MKSVQGFEGLRIAFDRVSAAAQAAGGACI